MAPNIVEQFLQGLQKLTGGTTSKKKSVSTKKKAPAKKSTLAKRKRVGASTSKVISLSHQPVHLHLRSPPQQKYLPLIKTVKGVVRLSARKVRDAYPNASEIVAVYNNREHVMKFVAKGVPRWVALPKY